MLQAVKLLAGLSPPPPPSFLLHVPGHIQGLNQQTPPSKIFPRHKPQRCSPTDKNPPTLPPAPYGTPAAPSPTQPPA